MMVRCKNCTILYKAYNEENVLVGKWCDKIFDCPDVEIERDCIFYNSMTNADIIRAMSDEELAKLMDDSVDYFNCDMCDYRDSNGYCDGIHCKDNILKWLQSEVEV